MTMRPTARLLAGMLSIAVAVPVASVAVAPVAGAATCSVTNARTTATTTSLRLAIKGAKAGDTLKVKGTCAGAFKVGKNLRLAGSGTAPTLKGAATGTVITIAAAAKVTLTGLTITGGTGVACVEWDGYVCAGGVLNNGTLTLDKVTIRNNTLVPLPGRPGAFGAGLYATYASRTTIKRSTIRNNSVTTDSGWAQGAGIVNEGTMLITGSTVSDNTATSAVESQGGAIFNAGSTTTAGHDVVGSLTITNSTISGNEAASSADGARKGGGIFNEANAESVVLRYVTIVGNAASSGGGIHSVAPLHLYGALIAGNIATSDAPDCLGGDVLSASNSLLGANDGCGITVGGDTGNQAGSIGAELDAKLGLLAKNGGPTRTHALLTGSPAIDTAGVAPCYQAKDQRGVTRPQGSACDIGAFEKG